MTESCSLPFPPKRKGKNSQGLIMIKIYNLYNVLHHRHLLVISTLVWLQVQGAYAWDGWKSVLCLTQLALLYSEGQVCLYALIQEWSCVHISAKAIAEKAIVAWMTVAHHQLCSALGHGRKSETEHAWPVSVCSSLSGATWWFFRVQPCPLNLARLFFFFLRGFSYPHEPNTIWWSIFSGYEQM